VPNLYPSLGEPHGAQEVAIHGGRHVVALADLTEPELALVCEAWAQRAEARRAAGWQHLFAFVNEGAGSGASLDHSHSQLAAFAEVPPGIAARAERCRQASCPVCHELASVEPERLVADGAVAVWTPWASASAFQLRAAPRAHADDGFADPAALAAALGAISHAFARALGPIPWNAWLYSAPLAGEASFHWHLEAFPRVAAMAAFELGAGLPICQIAPESAAARMRQA
jgi:UDPglucose--hexose-1-phosphate uridylyltransferase